MYNMFSVYSTLNVCYSIQLDSLLTHTPVHTPIYIYILIIIVITRKSNLNLQICKVYNSDGYINNCNTYIL